MAVHTGFSPFSDIGETNSLDRSSSSDGRSPGPTTTTTRNKQKEVAMHVIQEDMPSKNAPLEEKATNSSSESEYSDSMTSSGSLNILQAHVDLADADVEIA